MSLVRDHMSSVITTATDHGLCTTVKWEQRGQNPLESTLVLQLQRVLEKKWNTGHFSVPISDHRWRALRIGDTTLCLCINLPDNTEVIMYKLLKWKMCFSVWVMLVRLLNHCDSTPVPSHVDWFCVRWHRGVVHRINNTQMSLKKDRDWKQLSALSGCFRCEDIRKCAQSHLWRKVCWLSNQKTFTSKTNQHFVAAGSQAEDFSTCQILTALKVIVLYRVWRVVSILFTLPLCYRLALYWILHSVNPYLPRLVFCLSSIVSLHSEF